ncbi:MAG: GNAT family N-acetyltransferase [bacterium]
MLKILTKEEYELKIKEFHNEGYHLSQSGEWNNVQSLNFPDQVRFVYQNPDGYDLVIGRVVKSRILKAFNVLQLNYGPVIKVEEINQTQFDSFLSEIKEYFSTEKAFGTNVNIFLQISPVSLLTEKNSKLDLLLKNSKQLVKTKSSLRKLNSTIYVDLKDSIEDIQSNFRKDVRANLKKLQNTNGVVTNISYPEDKDNEKIMFEEFWINFTKSIEDKHFEDPGKKFYEKILSEGNARIMSIKLNGEILSGAFLYEFKEQESLVILSSFNTQNGVEYKSPTYMRFSIIKWAKEKGYKIVDFYDGGSTKGIREFKLGFTNKLVEYPECYDLVINKPLYPIALKKVFIY